MADSEIDGILLITMRHAGCDIPESMTLATLEPDVLVRTTSHCLALAGNDFPRYSKATLPAASQQSSRFRVCNVLSEAVKKLGYKNEIGFHQFLYPNAKDSRALLSFLMEHLPRNEGTDAAPASEISASILPLVSAELRKARALVWTCPSTRPRSLRHACTSSYRPILPVTSVATAALNPADTKLLVTEQVRDRHHLPPSLLERNAIALAAQQRRDLEWESGAGGEAAAEARRIALAKLVAAAFKGKVKGSGGGDGSGQSALDIVRDFMTGNKVNTRTHARARARARTLPSCINLQPPPLHTLPRHLTARSLALRKLLMMGMGVLGAGHGRCRKRTVTPPPPLSGRRKNGRICSGNRKKMLCERRSCPSCRLPLTRCKPSWTRRPGTRITVGARASAVLPPPV